MIWKNNSFQWNEIQIHQDTNVFKIGTDAISLGAWIPRILKLSPEFILDVGTGTGVLAIKLAHDFENSTVIAIDDNPQSATLARYNFQQSEMSERLSVIEGDLFDDQCLNDQKFDLIACNPPFFSGNDHLLPIKLATATHLMNTIAEWVRSLHNRLTNDGHLCIVIPFDSAATWIDCANQEKLFCNYRLNLYSFKIDDTPKRALLHFTKTLVQLQLEELVIYAKSGAYSQEYLDFSGIKPGIKLH